MLVRLAITALLFSSLPTYAASHVARFEINRREIAFEGRSFGKVGVYEKIVGQFWASLDPSDAVNDVIVDLDKAPRNSQGRVEYSAEFYILTPKNSTQTNQTLLYEIANRGNKNLLWMLNSAPVPPKNDPTSFDDAGDGFLMNKGYTLVWSGVYGDVTHVTDPNALTIQLPIARNLDGSPIEETIWDECNSSREGVDKPTCRLSYPVPRMDQSEVTLLVREKRSDTPREIPRDKWTFAGANAVQLLPQGETFKAGYLYQVVHRATDPPVMGVGLAAIRDLVTFLREERVDAKGNQNPIFNRIKNTVLMGWSQSGRMAREFLYRGFNQLESASTKKVFNGIIVFGAATRPFVNFRFAQPNRPPDMQHNTLYYPDSSFPFAYEVQKDLLTGRTDGLLRECLIKDTCPKIFHVVTPNEYWNYKNSQVTTDTLGTHDSLMPANVRYYLLAGLSHAPYPVCAPGVTEQLPNTTHYVYLLRNLVTKMTDWTRHGVKPPPSKIPSVASKTLVPVVNVKWPKIPRVTFAGPVMTRHPIIDYGSDFKQGIISKVLPVELPGEYPPLVPQVDADGNDLGGIRHPVVSVPLATRTGWALLVGPVAKGEIAGQDGSFIAFAKTKQERLNSGDPRLSIEERYPNFENYKQLVIEKANELVQQDFLLKEDLDAIVKQSLSEWAL